jgi:flagellar hook-length control protein FliK
MAPVDLPTAPPDSRAPSLPAAATGAEPLPAQILRRIPPIHTLSDRGAPLELTLDPPELGTIRISVTRGTEGMVLHLQADQPDTLDLLRRHGSMLAAEMQRQGLEQGSFSFSGRQGGQDRQAAPAPVPPDPDRTPAHRPQAEPPAPPAARSIARGQSLDLRL